MKVCVHVREEVHVCEGGGEEERECVQKGGGMNTY